MSEKKFGLFGLPSPLRSRRSKLNISKDDLGEKGVNRSVVQEKKEKKVNVEKKKLPVAGITAAARFMQTKSRKERERESSSGKSLHFGDVVRLRCKDSGYLVGEGFVRNQVGVVLGSDKSSHDRRLQMDEYETDFRICPQLRYDMQRIVAKFEKKSGCADQKSFVEERAEKEKFENALLLKSSFDVLRYGQVIQLEHVKSGKFVCCNVKKAALKNKDCLSVGLVGGGGSDLCWFYVLPRFKVHGQGTVVHDNDQIMFQPVKQDGYYLSGSSSYIEGGSVGCFGLSDERPWLECNLSVRVFSWKPLWIYGGRGGSNLRNGDALYLYHPEVERYVCGSVDYFDSRCDFSSQKVRGMWVFESSCGLLHWGDMVRVRHVATGRYLSVKEEGDADFLDVELGVYGSKLKLLPVKEASGLVEKSAVFRLCYDASGGVLYYIHASGGELKLSRVKHDQDALVGMDVGECDLRIVYKIKGWWRMAMDYCTRMNKDLSYQQVRPMIEGLLELTVGEVEEDEDEEDEVPLDFEVVKEERMDHDLALANGVFRKKLVVMDANLQWLLFELRFVDVLFHVISLCNSKEYRWVYYVHRLCYRALTAIFLNNHELELAVARMEVPVRPRECCGFLYERRDEEEVQNVLMVVASQLTLGSSAVAMLRTLVDNNETLLDERVGSTQVSRFVGLIREHGFKKHFLDLLSALCTCQDLVQGKSKCVVSNQELVVLEILRDSHEILIEMDIEDGGDVVLVWGGKKKKLRESVVEPECKEICDYMLSLLGLYSKMTQGRSYNCIEKVSEKVSLKLLLVGIGDERLPCNFRAAFADLLNHVYLNRYPNNHLIVPRRVWSEGSEEGMPKGARRKEWHADLIELVKRCLGESTAVLKSKLIVLGTEMLRMGFFNSKDMEEFVLVVARQIAYTMKGAAGCKLREQICEFLYVVSEFEVDSVAGSYMSSWYRTCGGGDSSSSSSSSSSSTCATRDDFAAMDEILIKLVDGHCRSERLYEYTLKLLMAQHYQESNVLDNLDEKLILDTPSKVEFYETMARKSAELRNDFESFEIWGVSNEFSDIGWDVVKRTQVTLRFLRKCCPKHMDVVECLNVFDIVLMGLQLDSPRTEHLDKIKRLCLEFMREYAGECPENQVRLSNETGTLVALLPIHRNHVLSVLTAMVNGNRKLCSNIDASLVEEVLRDVEEPGLYFLCQISAVAGMGIRANQDLVLRTLLECGVLKDLISCSKPSKRVLVLELLSAITRGRNPYSESKIQMLLPLENVLDNLTVGEQEDNRLYCVSLRYIADAFFDTGLSQKGNMQQEPGVISLLASVLVSLEQFVARQDTDTVLDTLSNYRSLVFHGFLFLLRAFFQHSFDFHSAPVAVMDLRQPLLSVCQRLEELCESDVEESITRRATSTLLRSIRGPRGKKNPVANLGLTGEAANTTAKGDSSGTRTRTRTRTREKKKEKRLNQKNFAKFCKKTRLLLKDRLEQQDCMLVKSIVRCCPNLETLERFMSLLMVDYVRKATKSLERIPKRSAQGATSVMTLVRLIIQFPSYNLGSQEFQNHLTAWGGVEMCFDLFCQSKDSSLMRSTIHTFISLLEGGNSVAQRRLLELLQMPKGQAFLKRMGEVFRVIGDAAKLEIRLEKKRRIQQERSMQKDDSDTASVASGASSILESVGHSTTLDYNSGSSSSSSDDSESSSSSVGSLDDVDSTIQDSDSEQQQHDDDDDDELQARGNIENLFQASLRTTTQKKRKRTQVEREQKQQARDIVSVIRFLQLCMEGHYGAMQNFLRDQHSAHKQSINIIAAAANHARILTKNEEILASINHQTLLQLVGIFDLLIECMQGPCYENQRLLVDPMHHVIDMVKSILLTKFALGQMAVFQLKGRVVRTLCSMLEGRHDTQVLEVLSDQVSPDLLRQHLCELYQAISLEPELEPGNDSQNQILEGAIDTMTVLMAISEYKPSKPKPLTNLETKTMAYFQKTIRSVEVLFKDSVHRVFYPKPRALDFMGASTRVRLLADIDDTETDARLVEFLESARSVLDELVQIQQISESMPVLQMLMMDLDNVRTMAYLLACMSNLLLLISFNDQDLTTPSVPIAQLFPLVPGVPTCLALVQLITAVQIILLVVLRLLHFTTYVPIVFKKLQRRIRLAKAKRLTTQRIYVPGALALTSADQEAVDPLSLAIAYIVFTALVWTRFGYVIFDNSQFLFVTKVCLAVQLALFLKSARQNGLATAKSNKLSLWYCCAYDVLAETQTLFQIASIFSCAAGITLGPQAYYLVLPLFDIVLSSETLLNVVRAVVVPVRSLFMTFLLLALVLYGFAFLAFTHFRDHFAQQDCGTLLNCFMTSLDIGLRIGEGPAAVMDQLPATHALKIQRYFFDLFFVVVISIFLLQSLFGVLLDTYGNLREKQESREERLKNYCFICAKPRAEFDALVIEYKQKQQQKQHYPLKSGFFYHISEEHSLFDYLGFILYLEEKDKTECNGLESYVLDELDKSGGDSVHWIPNGSSLATAQQTTTPTTTTHSTLEQRIAYLEALSGSSSAI